MEVSRDKLESSGEGKGDILNVKGDPRLIDSYSTQKELFPAYHMNKENWISTFLDKQELVDTIKNDTIFKLLIQVDVLGVSTATVKRTLAKMQQEGKVIREGSNRKGKWILSEKYR